MPSPFARAALLLCAWVAVSSLRAMGPFQPMDLADHDALFLQDSIILNSSEAPENTRLLSSGLAVLLGPFGAHRLYLGTTPKVAIIYGVTFGGFGVLALLDLGHLLFTKDIDPYRNSDRVFMWGKDGKEPTPP